MWETLLWLSSLVAAALALAALWNRPPPEGRRKPLVLPAFVTVVALGASLGLLAIVRQLDVQGFRPNPLAPLAAWNVALAASVAVLVALSWRAPRFRTRTLLIGAGVGLFASLASYVAVDLSRRGDLERRWEEAARKVRALDPPKLAASEDARPLYERALQLLGEKDEWPRWTGEPAAAARSRPEVVRRYLESRKEAMAAAREARGLPGYTIERPLLALDEASWEPLAGLRQIAWLVQARCVLCALDGDVEGVRDSIEWLGDLSRHLARDPHVISFLVAQAVAELRVRALEDALGALGPGARLPLPTFPQFSDEDLREQLVSTIEREGAFWEYNLLSMWLGKVPLEKLVGEGRQLRPVFGLPLVHNEWLRFYRVFALPMDIRVLETHISEVIRRARRLGSGEPSDSEAPDLPKLGVSFTAAGIVGPLGTMARKVQRLQTLERLARAGWAVGHRRAERGEYPRALADLVPDFLSAVPVDACLGRPLRYERAGDGGDGAAVWSDWDGRRDEAREPPGDGEPGWKAAAEDSREPRLVFFLGSLWRENLRDEPVEFEDGEELESEAGEEVEARTEPEAGTESEAGEEVEARTEPEAETESDAGKEVEARTEPEAETESKAGKEVEARTEPEAGAEPEAGTEKEAGAEEPPGRRGGKGDPEGTDAGGEGADEWRDAAAAERVPLFDDTAFRRGFLLSYPSSAKGRAVEKVLDGGGAAAPRPAWRLCQWATRVSLAAAEPVRLPDGAVSYEDATKRVVFGGGAAGEATHDLPETARLDLTTPRQASSGQDRSHRWVPSRRPRARAPLDAPADPSTLPADAPLPLPAFPRPTGNDGTLDPDRVPDPNLGQPEHPSRSNANPNKNNHLRSPAPG